MFESNRVRLEKLTMDHIGILHKWRRDPELLALNYPQVEVYAYEDTEAYVEGLIMGFGSSLNFIILEKYEDLPLGLISLVNIDSKNRNGECIIEIGEKSYWNKGYGSEALGLLLDLVFLEMNFHRIYLRVFSFNKRALGFYEKLGFKVEGRSREAIYRYGGWHDIVNMGILRGEYL